jgi:hypothetical protein
MTALSPDRDSIMAFLTAMLGDQIHLAAINPDPSPIVARDFANDVHAAAEWAVAENARGINIHYTPNRVRPGLHKKPSKSDLTEMRVVHVDIDPPKDGGPFDAEQVVADLRACPMPPHAIVNSGNGLQALWQITGGDMEAVEAVNRGVIQRFAGDSSTPNAERLLRLPHTVNWPDKNKRLRGYLPVLAKTLFIGDHPSHDLASLSNIFPAERRPEKSPSKQALALRPTAPVTRLTADDLGLSKYDRLRALIEDPNGDDRSRDTFAFACKALERGYDEEQIIGVLLNPDNAIAAHCLDQKDPTRAARRAVQHALEETDVARRFRQRDEDKCIGKDDADDFPRSPEVTLDELLEYKVFIADGSMIADVRRPRSLLAKADFNNAYASSKAAISIRGQNKLVPVTNLWLQHAARLQTHTITFHPGHGLFTADPDGKEALNLWRPLELGPVPGDWADRAKPFQEHVRWLWGEDADAFLDWLAHIIQRPHELPSFGWLHVAPLQGLGRNWVSSILKRILRSGVALGFDLMGALKSGFNGDLGMRLLAVVDEIDEGGGGERFRHAQALKQIVTEETRRINPKYGRQRTEYNSCRWLIFSNSLTALPLEERDRRFWVVRCDDKPRDAAYYQTLYTIRDDAEFIASVAYWLAERDIASFKPGAAPPVTAAKQALLERTRSPEEQVLHDVKAHWPLELVTSDELKKLMGENALTFAALRHALDRAGLEKVGAYKTTKDWCDGRHNVTIYARDNVAHWKGADIATQRHHIDQMTFKDKELRMECADLL